MGIERVAGKFAAVCQNVVPAGNFRLDAKKPAGLHNDALLPPQIMQLSLALGSDYDGIDTCEEMTQFLVERRQAK